MITFARRPGELGLQGFKVKDAGTREGQERLHQAVIDDITRQPQLFQFTLDSQSKRRDSAGTTYFESEFRVSLCKGEVIEGRKGVRRYASDAISSAQAVPHTGMLDVLALAGCAPRFGGCVLVWFARHNGQQMVAGSVSTCVRCTHCQVVTALAHCRCVAGNDNVIPTPTKHVFSSAAIGKDGNIYIMSASSFEERWAAAGSDLVNAASSLAIA
jgi:hypothetical protein